MTMNCWRHAPVLVTGARGFIASHLCARLAAEGADVFGVSSSAHARTDDGMELLRVDLTDLAATEELVQRTQPDLIFHLAGHVTGSQSLDEVRPTLAANLISTVNLLIAVQRRRGCRVVIAGSMQEPDRLDHSGIPCSPYAASKFAATTYARMFHALYGLPVVVARLMMVYGPGQWDLNKMLPYVATSLLAGASPRLASGLRELDWVYVSDVVDGLLTLAKAPHVAGATVDFGSGTLTSVRSIVERVAAIIESPASPQFNVLADRPLERPRTARVEATAALIGWTATTPLDHGLRLTVDWYRQLCASPKPA